MSPRHPSNCFHHSESLRPPPAHHFSLDSSNPSLEVFLHAAVAHDKEDFINVGGPPPSGASPRNFARALARRFEDSCNRASRFSVFYVAHAGFSSLDCFFAHCALTDPKIWLPSLFTSQKGSSRNFSEQVSVFFPED